MTRLQPVLGFRREPDRCDPAEACRPVHVVRDRLRRDMDLTGKTAIVTGASSGIGAATVRKLREAGVRVAGGARRVERVEADVALAARRHRRGELRRRSSRRPSPRSAASTSSSTTPGLALGRAPFTESTADGRGSACSTRTSTACCA